MAREKYTSINVLEDQHTQLKKIANFKKVRITDLGVEIAGDYIQTFLSKHGEVMAEMDELEARMSQLRVKFKE